MTSFYFLSHFLFLRPLQASVMLKEMQRRAFPCPYADLCARQASTLPTSSYQVPCRSFETIFLSATQSFQVFWPLVARHFHPKRCSLQ